MTRKTKKNTCAVCHTRLSRGGWCSDACRDELARRATALETHVRQRSNNWPTSAEWRRFAALVCDYEQARALLPAKPTRVQRKRLAKLQRRVYAYPQWREVYSGLAPVSAAGRLGRELLKRRPRNGNS